MGETTGIRQRFWFAVMDVTVALDVALLRATRQISAGLERLNSFALVRAAKGTDYGSPEDGAEDGDTRW